MFHIKYLTMHTVQKHTDTIKMIVWFVHMYGEIIHLLCAYEREVNSLAIARELSSRTYAQTIQYLTLTYFKYMVIQTLLYNAVT